MQKLFTQGINSGKIVFPFLIVLFLFSCEYDEGKGGTSTISGVVEVQELSRYLEPFGEPYPAQDVDVYLIYGDEEIYGDKFQTGWDGKFEFNYLHNGNYTLYVLSTDTTNNLTDQKIPVFVDVEITDKNQSVSVDTIKIFD